MANEHSFGSCSKHNTIVRVIVFNQWPTTIDASFRQWNRNDPFNEPSRRKQTARSNDRKRVSVYDLNDLADVQGSVLSIVVWSGCFPETNKVIQKDPFGHTKFYTTHQTVLTSRQWRYLCMPKPSNSINAWRTSGSYQHIQSFVLCKTTSITNAKVLTLLVQKNPRKFDLKEWNMRYHDEGAELLKWKVKVIQRKLPSCDHY